MAAILRHKCDQRDSCDSIDVHQPVWAPSLPGATPLFVKWGFFRTVGVGSDGCVFVCDERLRSCLFCLTLFTDAMLGDGV